MHYSKHPMTSNRNRRIFVPVILRSVFCKTYFPTMMWSLIAMLYSGLLPTYVHSAPLVITETNAAQSFINGDYRSALEGFNELRIKYPLDLRIRRYQAITLEKLGEDDRAIEILTELLLITPDSVSSQYYLGTIYYKLQKAELAESHFSEVLLLANDSKYGSLAQSYLDAIGSQKFESANPGAPRRWNFYSSIGYTDDVSSDPSLTSEDTSRPRINSYFSANYYFLRESNWTGLISGSVYQSNQQSSSVSTDRTLRQWSTKASLQNQTTLMGKPVIHIGNLGYDRVMLDGSKYSDNWFLYGSTRLRLRPNLSTSVYVSKGKRRFWVMENLSSSLSTADRNKTSLGLNQSIFLNDRTIELGGGVYFKEITSLNPSSSHKSRGAKIFSRFSLPQQVRFGLTVESSKDTYPSFNGVENRAANTKTLSTTLSRRFGKHLSVELSYKISEVGFSDVVGDRGRDTWGVRFSYVY